MRKKGKNKRNGSSSTSKISRNTKRIKKKVKTKRSSRRTSKQTCEHEIGFADKLSRLFYNWMKKKPNDVKILRAGPFEIQTFICEGAFGRVMTAINKHTHVTVAAKLEKKKIRRPSLEFEFKIYEMLGSDVPGFPKVYFYGPCNKYYNVLIMDLLGPDLEDLFHACNYSFSHKTILNIAMQILLILKHIHSKNIIYRDIKAENFCIGHHFQNKQNMIHVIDFGLAKIEGDVSDQCTAQKCNYYIGTPRYMSMNAHGALELSKRDDLQSLGYLLVYFIKGHLPWMGISQDYKDSRELFKDIAETKQKYTVEDLIPDYPEFIAYFESVSNLAYNEEPDYSFIYDLFKNSYEAHGYEYDNKFEWTDMMNKRFLAESIDIDPDD